MQIDLIQKLVQLDTVSKGANDLIGRNLAPYLAVVANIDDPLEMRRIKVISPVNPNLETDWIRRLDITNQLDAPLPKIGQTVIVFSIDGVLTNGWYLTVINATNKPLDKEDAAKDFQLESEGRYKVVAENTIELLSNSGATIKIEPSGQIEISTSETIKLLANSIELETNSATINGSAIATVGAIDSRGDVLVSKGWT